MLRRAAREIKVWRSNLMVSHGLGETAEGLYKEP